MKSKMMGEVLIAHSIIYLEKGKVYYSTQSTLKHLNISEVVSL